MENNKPEIADLGKSVGMVYHYTKMSNLANIITPKGVVFHAGRYDSMNDPEDSEYLVHNINHLRFETGLFDILGEFGGDDLESFLVSFSRERDNSLMWRLYNADVCLHIDSDIVYEYFKSKGCKYSHMSEITYSEKFERDSNVSIKMNQALNQPRLMELREYEASVYASFYKHPVFSVENEWRIACFAKDPVYSEVKSKGTRYGVMSLYRELYLPSECLKGITVREYDAEQKLVLSRQIEFWLKECDFSLQLDSINFTKMPNVR